MNSEKPLVIAHWDEEVLRSPVVKSISLVSSINTTSLVLKFKEADSNLFCFMAHATTFPSVECRGKRLYISDPDCANDLLKALIEHEVIASTFAEIYVNKIQELVQNHKSSIR